MKPGDIVKWIGFFPEKTQQPPDNYGGMFGIVVQYNDQGWKKVTYDVLWSDGTIGHFLFPETLEVVEDGINKQSDWWK